MTFRLILRTALAAAILTAGALHAFAQDAAYVDDQLAEGRRAWGEKQYAEAAEHFRLAAFAAVEAPVHLTESLARLALAQEAAGAHADADATLARFLEVEEHSSRYGEAALELPVKGAFERLLRTRVSPDRLAAVPTLASAARGDPPAEPRPRATPAPAEAPSATPDAALPSPTEPPASPQTPANPVLAASAPRPTATPVPSPPPPSEPPAPAELPSPTAIPAPTETPVPPPTPTRRPPPPTSTPSSTRTPSETPTPRPTRTSRPPTATRTETPIPTDTATSTATPTVTLTPTPRPPTATRTSTETPTSPPTRTPRPPTPTRTPTQVPTTAVPTRTPLPPTPRPPATPRTLLAEAVDQPPRVLQIVQPVYPPDALRRRVRGLVVLRALISENGVPLQTEVVQGAPGGLTEAALTAVVQWRFEPARAAGSPVRTYMTIRIPFEGVQFATPTPREESREESKASRDPSAAEAPATPTPTHSPANAMPAAAPGALARAAFDDSTSPVPPEPPSGEKGPDGPVVRTRRAVRIALSQSQARVWIDGRFVGIAGDWDRRRGGVEFVLDRPGPHEFHAELPGYRPFEAEIDVAETAVSESASVTGTLSRFAITPFARLTRPAAATRGSIALAVDRPDAQLFVDGVAAGLASDFGDREPLRLSGPAVHELRITSPGGVIRTLRVVVSPAAPAEVPVLRVRIAGAAVPVRESLAGGGRE